MFFKANHKPKHAFMVYSHYLGITPLSRSLHDVVARDLPFKIWAVGSSSGFPSPSYETITIIKGKLVTMANLKTGDYDVSNVLSARDLLF